MADKLELPKTIFCPNCKQEREYEARSHAEVRYLPNKDGVLVDILENCYMLTCDECCQDLDVEKLFTKEQLKWLCERIEYLILFI